jgi:hypothetical protein
MRAEYTIPAGNFDIVADLVEKLNRRATKLNIQGITVEVLEEEIRADEDGLVGKRFLNIRLIGTTPKIEGWEFLATLEHMPGGNIIRKMPTVEGDVPEEYRTVEPWCYHCQTMRPRNDTFLVRHEDGRIVQVGRTCLRDFLGHKDPHAVANWLSQLEEAFERIHDEVSRESYGRGCGEPLLSLDEVLSHAACMIRNHGWTSSAQVQSDPDGSKVATGTLTRINIDNMRTRQRSWNGDPLWDTPNEDDTAVAQLTIKYIRDVLSQKTELNDYEHNLKVAFSSDWVKSRSIGIVASAIAAMKRHQDRLRERKEGASQAEIKDEFIGVVGGRLTARVNVQKIIPISSDFGVSHLHVMCDPDGRLIKWFSTSSVLEEGKTYDITAKIKKHTEFKGSKETVVNYVKAQEII